MRDEARSRRIWSTEPSPRSGYPGVTWDRPTGRWLARASSPVSRRRVSLGTHDTAEAAIAAVKDYEGLFDFDFRRKKKRP